MTKNLDILAIREKLDKTNVLLGVLIEAAITTASPQSQQDIRRLARESLENHYKTWQNTLNKELEKLNNE